MAIFGPKPWVNPFRKMAIFRRFNLLVWKAQKGVFTCYNVLKDIFMACFAPPKNVKKMAIFGPKPRVNPVRKMAIFLDFLNFLFLKPRKASLRSKTSSNTFSWPILPEEKKLKKWPFLDQNHGLTPVEKCQFFHFLILSFLQPTKGIFFVLEYRKTHFPSLYCPKKRS